MKKQDKKQTGKTNFKNTAELISFYSETWAALAAYDKKERPPHNHSNDINLELILKLLSKK